MFDNLINKIKNINITHEIENNKEICNDCNKYEDKKNKHIYCRICEDCDNKIHIYCSVCQICHYEEDYHD